MNCLKLALALVFLCFAAAQSVAQAGASGIDLLARAVELRDAQPDSARALAARALEVSETGDSVWLDAHYELATLDRRQGRYKAAVARLRNMLRRAEDELASDPRRSFKANYGLGLAYYDANRPDSSMAFFDVALQAAKKARAPELEASALNSIGNIYFDRGDLPKTTELCNRSALIYTEAGMPQEAAYSWANLGGIMMTMEHPEKAKDYFEKAMAAADSAAQPGLWASLLLNSAILRLSYPPPDSASATSHARGILSLSGRALTAFRQQDNAAGMIRAHSVRAKAYELLNDDQRAVAEALAGLGLARKTGARGHIVSAQAEYARLLLAQGDARAAAAEYDEALALADSSIPVQERLGLLQSAAKAFAEAGDAQRAYQLLERRGLLYQKMHDKERAELILQMQNDRELAEKEIELKTAQAAEAALLRKNNWLAFASALAALAAVAAVILALRQRRSRRRLKARNAELNSAVERRKQLTDELRKQNEELNELNQFKNDMVHMLVHDLKSPLNALQATTSMPDDQKRRQVIRAASARMDRLVMNLLDVERLKTAEAKFELKSISVEKALLGAREEIEFLANNKGVAIRLQGDRRAACLADPMYFERVLANLLSNAVKFAPSGGQVALRYGLEGRAAWFEVWNNGPEIPADQLDTIFDKYHTSGVSDEKNLRGTGLGLNFCKLVVEKHGGAIYARTPPEGGAVFRVELPGTVVAEAAPEPGKAARFNVLNDSQRQRLAPLLAEIRAVGECDPSVILPIVVNANLPDDPAVSRWREEMENAAFGHDLAAMRKLVLQADAEAAKRSLLVCDDDPLNLHMTLASLKDAGRRVITATNGEQALRVIKRRQPALVLLDVDMPVLDGAQTLTRIRQDPARCWTPVFLFARFGADSVAEADYDLLLPKPTSSEKLVAAIADYMPALPKNAEAV